MMTIELHRRLSIIFGLIAWALAVACRAETADLDRIAAIWDANESAVLSIDITGHYVRRAATTNVDETLAKSAFADLTEPFDLLSFARLFAPDLDEVSTVRLRAMGGMSRVDETFSGVMRTSLSSADYTLRKRPLVQNYIHLKQRVLDWKIDLKLSDFVFAPQVPEAATAKMMQGDVMEIAGANDKRILVDQSSGFVLESKAVRNGGVQLVLQKQPRLHAGVAIPAFRLDLSLNRDGSVSRFSAFALLDAVVNSELDEDWTHVSAGPVNKIFDARTDPDNPSIITLEADTADLISALATNDALRDSFDLHPAPVLPMVAVLLRTPQG